MIPDDVREWIDRKAIWDINEFAADGQTLDCWAKLVYDEAIAVRDWLQSQPTAPEPDWSTASPDTQYHTIDASGLGIWWNTSHPPQPVVFLWVSDELDKEQQYFMIVDYVYDLPLGIDWRTTLRRRPEGVVES